MNLLPVEALHKILLNLRVNFLITLNKYFLSLYNAHYYKCYLELKYPELSFVGNFKKLCKKSLNEGNVSRLTKKYIVTPTDVKAVKAISVSHDRSPIQFLRFNGDLYLCDGQEKILFDTNVTDIETSTYIKKNEWYFILNNNSLKNIHDYYRHLIIKSDKKFLALGFYNRWNVVAHTSKTVYYYNSNNFLLTSKTFDIPIRNISKSISSRNTFILFKNGELGIFDNQFNAQMVINNVEDIGTCARKIQGVWRLNNETIYGSFEHLGRFKNFVDSVYSYILTDRGLFFLNDLKFNKCNTNFKIINIYGNMSGVYQITVPIED
jgi:hypothetical protein